MMNSITLSFEIRGQLYDTEGPFKGKFYIVHVNNCGRATLFLRNDGAVSDVRGYATELFYFDTFIAAENALKAFYWNS